MEGNGEVVLIFSRNQESSAELSTSSWRRKMRNQNMQVSMETVIAASPLMGHELENRDCINQAQNELLADRLSLRTEVSLRGQSQRDLFTVAPLDILVSEKQGRKQFHLLELNGTGIGGVTNMPEEQVGSILESLEDTASRLDCPNGIILLAISGKESNANPRLNRLMHEKMLFAEALRRGLTATYGRCDVRNVDQMKAAAEQGTATEGPTVVMGYMKDLLKAINLEEDGTLTMHGRHIAGALNDRFCRNLLTQFHDRVDLSKFQTINRTFSPGSDKGIAYKLMNEFVQDHPHSSLPDGVPFAHCHTRKELIETVLDWVRGGREVVIKPHGTGLGHGIEFFLESDEAEEAIIERIDQSLELTGEYYGISGGALPYTVCEYIDACKVQEEGHEFEGHKYELRVVVYRDGETLKAFPSIAKVARERTDDNVFVRRALINNITASGDTVKVSGTDYMLPLCNERTLELLGLSEIELHQLCRMATGYVRHVLDRMEDAPAEFGLPASDAEVAAEDDRDLEHLPFVQEAFESLRLSAA
ncbi:MAG: hypothetical protein WD045_12270 [Pirellulaceae bacterium]